jgi:DNA-binding transcriptional regulator YiaG
VTSKQLRSIRLTLNLSAEGLAQLLQVQSGRTVRRWGGRRAEIPGPVAVILMALSESEAVREYFGVSVEAE